jgi:uncharacterized protein (TIRG00374 family)
MRRPSRSSSRWRPRYSSSPSCANGGSIGLIALILWRADLRATVDALKGLQLVPFFGALLTSTFAVVLRAYKWHLLLHVQGGSRPFGTSLRVTFMSSFVNNFFLGTLGGDAYRAYHAGDYSKSTGGAATAVLMERATGLLSALLLVFVVGIFLSYDFVTTELLPAISLVGFAGFAAIIAAATLGARAARLPLVRRVRRLTRLIEEVSSSLNAYRDHRGLVLFTLLLSLVFHALQSVTLLLFVVAAGVDAPFLTLLFIAPLTGILVVLPISMNGLGVKEGSLVFFLERIGTPGPDALLIALLGRVGNMTISLIGGLLFLLERSSRDKVAAPTG